MSSSGGSFYDTRSSGTMSASPSPAKAGQGARLGSAEKVSDIAIKDTMRNQPSCPSPGLANIEKPLADADEAANRKTQDLRRADMGFDFQCALQAVNSAHSDEMPDDCLAFVVYKAASYGTLVPTPSLKMLLASSTVGTSPGDIMQTLVATKEAKKPAPRSSKPAAPREAADMLLTLAAGSKKGLLDSIHAPKLKQNPASSENSTIVPNHFARKAEAANMLIAPTTKPKHGLMDSIYASKTTETSDEPAESLEAADLPVALAAGSEKGLMDSIHAPKPGEVLRQQECPKKPSGVRRGQGRWRKNKD